LVAPSFCNDPAVLRVAAEPVIEAVAASVEERDSYSSGAGKSVAVDLKGCKRG
jgi:hypothetical protein